jgi:hypothetical protein
MRRRRQVRYQAWFGVMENTTGLQTLGRAFLAAQVNRLGHDGAAAVLFLLGGIKGGRAARASRRAGRWRYARRSWHAASRTVWTYCFANGAR